MTVNGRLKKRGASLIIMVMFFMTLIMIVLIPMLGFVDHMRKVSARRQAGDLAFYAAESGIAMAVSYIQEQSQGILNDKFNVNKDSSFHPFGNPANGLEVDVNRSLADLESVNEPASYAVNIYSETTDGNKRFIIESTGRSTLALQNIYRRVIIEIRPASFAQYAFFNTASLSTMDGRSRWLGAGEEFWGPVHSNRNLYVYGSDAAHLVFNSAVNIVRQEVLSGSSDYVDYLDGMDDEADYVVLPSDLAELKAAAQSGGTFLDGTDGSDDEAIKNLLEYIADNGIAYTPPAPPTFLVDAPIHNYEFEFIDTGSEDTAKVKITNLNLKQNLDYAALGFSDPDDVAAEKLHTWERGLSDTNGAIVVDEGNVFIHGTVDGKYTVAALGTADPAPTAYKLASNGNVVVNGDLVYAGHDDLSACDDILGLIAERNFAVDADTNTNTYIDAHILLTGQASPNPRVDGMREDGTIDTGSEWVQDGPSDTVTAAIGQDGAFFIEDGIQLDLSRRWSGGIDDSTGADTGGWKLGDLYLNGGVVHFIRGQTLNSAGGYSRHYVFDKRLSANPPPFYPRMSDTAISSWREKRHAGGDSFDF